MENLYHESIGMWASATIKSVSMSDSMTGFGRKLRVINTNNINTHKREYDDWSPNFERWDDKTTITIDCKEQKYPNWYIIEKDWTENKIHTVKFLYKVEVFIGQIAEVKWIIANQPALSKLNPKRYNPDGSLAKSYSYIAMNNEANSDTFDQGGRFKIV